MQGAKKHQAFTVNATPQQKRKAKKIATYMMYPTRQRSKKHST
jgi:hypothetical protein